MDKFFTQIKRSCLIDNFEEYLFDDIGAKNAIIAAGLSGE